MPAQKPETSVSEQGAASRLGVAARLLPLSAGFYAFSLAPGQLAGNAGANAVPAVRVCAAPGAPELDIVDLTGRVGSWLVGEQRLFVTAPPGGTVALLTACRPGDTRPLDIEIRRLDRPQPVRERAPAGVADGNGLDLVLGFPRETLPAAIEAAATLRGEGELRFIGTDWVGRLGTGRWIESFTLLPREELPPFEYKALTADGQETAWIAAGGACGAPGTNVALIGFAVRQRPGSGPPLLDCEYSGAFHSGGVSGPVRNGAPCLSPTGKDALEGLQLRLVPRPHPATG